MLWDTAGQEEFDAITKAYYRGAQACVLTFSTVDRASFQAVRHWKKKVSTSFQVVRHWKKEVEHLHPGVPVLEEKINFRCADRRGHNNVNIQLHYLQCYHSATPHIHRRLIMVSPWEYMH